MFTQRHFVAIAKEIAEALWQTEREPAAQEGVRLLKVRLMSLFQRTNPRFDWDRFDDAAEKLLTKEE